MKKFIGIVVLGLLFCNVSYAWKITSWKVVKVIEEGIYLDSNSDLKRAMGVSTVPHTFLLNGKNEIVWHHKGYADGDEVELLKEIKKLSK